MKSWVVYATYVLVPAFPDSFFIIIFEGWEEQTFQLSSGFTWNILIFIFLFKKLKCPINVSLSHTPTHFLTNYLEVKIHPRIHHKQGAEGHRVYLHCIPSALLEGFSSACPAHAHKPNPEMWQWRHSRDTFVQMFFAALPLAWLRTAAVLKPWRGFSTIYPDLVCLSRSGKWLYYQD